MKKNTSTKKYLTIKNYHLDDRPREKLIHKGKHTLTKAELLAMIINTGIQNTNSVDLARHILAKHNNNLNNLAKLSIQELMTFKGIGQAKAATIVGTFELANRLENDRHLKQPIIKKTTDIYKLMKPRLSQKIVEEFWIILLNNQHQVLKTIQISQGGLRATTVDKQIILKECLLHNATATILVHNHPSGNIQPSLTDIKLTKNILQASTTLNITILDHLIFTDNNYFSFADEGLIDSLQHQSPSQTPNTT